MCEQSATSFPIMVRLTPDEYVEYHALGWTFLQYMAEKINYWASTYSARRVSNELRAAAEAVIADATERRDKETAGVCPTVPYGRLQDSSCS
jgi:hypothetical protein